MIWRILAGVRMESHADESGHVFAHQEKKPLTARLTLLARGQVGNAGRDR